MIGAEATELIQGYTIGKTAELVDGDFIRTVFPHPTLSSGPQASLQCCSELTRPSRARLRARGTANFGNFRER